MPVPAILGLPALATAIGAILAGVVEFFARYVTKKVAIIAVAIAAAITVVTAFIAALYALATSITSTIPSDLLAHGGLFFPPNLDDVVVILVTARFAKWIYRWNIRAIEWKLMASV